MARGIESEDEGSQGPKLSLIDSIHRIAYHNARAELDSEEQLLLYLQSWWSRTYNRPLKDPLLLTYTLEELIYEFYDRIERQKAQQEQIERDSDKIEETKEKAALDWAEEEERKELAAEAARNLKKDAPQDPTKDPENIAWMEKQLAEAKQAFGEDFGEDIEDNFED